jgi:hypothetical protein
MGFHFVSSEVSELCGVRQVDHDARDLETVMMLNRFLGGERSEFPREIEGLARHAGVGNRESSGDGTISVPAPVAFFPGNHPQRIELDFGTRRYYGYHSQLMILT